MKNKFYINFKITGRYLKGIAFDFKDPKKPILVEISLNSYLMCKIRCVGIVYAPQIIHSIPEEHRNIFKDIREMPGAFEYYLSDYLPLGSSMNLSISIVSENGEKQYSLETLINLKEDLFNSLKDYLEKLPLVRFNVLSYDNDLLKIKGILYKINDDDDLNLACNNCVLDSIASDDFSNHNTFPNHLKGILLSANVLNNKEDAKVFLKNHNQQFGGYGAALYIPANFPDLIKNFSAPFDYQINRVMASSSFLDYFFSGFTSYSVIKQILEKYSGSNIESLNKILDWGVGCGRVTQHILKKNSSVIGIDIDKENVSWCKNNLAGDYKVIPLKPPINLLDKSIDLVIGISVFTHLNEEDQFLWLEELERIIKPGGHALVTINSKLSLFSTPEPVRRYLSLKSYGIDDSVRGNLLDDVIGTNNDYYRETFHCHEYIKEKWSKWFEVIGIEIGAHFCHQDYIILRSRK